MKILYITNKIVGSGGLERVLAVKSDCLINTFKYDVYILTLNQNQKENFYDFNSKIKHHNIEVSGNPLKYFIEYRKGVKNKIAEIKPDIISVCDDGLKGLLFPILFDNRIPVIYERHASINLNFKGKEQVSFLKKTGSYFQHKLMIFGAKRFDTFVVLTEGNNEDWPNVDCTVIPNPSPFPPFNDLAVKENIVLAVGSQSYNKGYDRLINIWRKVNEKYPLWKLKIYGKQSEELKLQEKINEFGLDECVFLNDPIKNIEEQYKKASIFVMPSRSEGFGMVLIEAMNYGVPCVSFDCPHGPADIIKNDEDGFLIENGNTENFANAVISLIEDKEKRERMGNNARENVMRYMPESIMQPWNSLFKNLVKG
ncbi:MAG: hypothetical protein COA67_11190 [Lutibacter sp.]|nr:MAG: hypothetical protein COA67_11190 [Lutibacter sp.]